MLTIKCDTRHLTNCEPISQRYSILVLKDDPGSENHISNESISAILMQKNGMHLNILRVVLSKIIKMVKFLWRALWKTNGQHFTKITKIDLLLVPQKTL